MSEYRRRIALGAVVAIVLALALGFVVVQYFPSGATRSITQISSVTSTETLTATTTAVSTTTAITTATSVSMSTSTATSVSTATTTATSTATATITVSSATTSSYTTTPATSTVTLTATTTAATTTTTCALCSTLAIISANLTVNPSTNRATLSVALKNNGSGNASSLVITLGSTEIVVLPELDAGQQTWLSVQIPSQVAIQTGESYQITVSTQFRATMMETSTSVTAGQG